MNPRVYRGDDYMYCILYCIFISFLLIFVAVSIRYVKKLMKASYKENMQNYQHSITTICEIAEYRYGRSVREYKDISEYYALEKTIRFPKN